MQRTTSAIALWSVLLASSANAGSVCRLTSLDCTHVATEVQLELRTEGQDQSAIDSPRDMTRNMRFDDVMMERLQKRLQVLPGAIGQELVRLYACEANDRLILEMHRLNVRASLC
jgi:hypothetical protein